MMTIAEEEIVQLRYEGSTAILTLNNPRRINAFSLAMRRALYDHLLAINADPACRAIVLTGAGGNLSAGGDISEMERRGLIESRARVEFSSRIFKLLATGPKPLICAVEGKAFGCAVSFTAVADYAVAATDSTYSCAFIKVGLMPDIGATWSIPRKIGHRKAMEMCAFADVYDAQQALDMQLVNTLCEPGQALAQALLVAERFAKMPPIAIAMMRQALNSGMADTPDGVVETEMNLIPILMGTEDFGEATTAFMEKRKPVFTGN